MALSQVHSLFQVTGVLDALRSKQGGLRATELAEVLGVSRQLVYKMAAKGIIPSYRVGKAVRFDPKQVASWLQDERAA